jgi:ubiquinone/menaquinone biosynthesis C-methylase UbiE
MAPDAVGRHYARGDLGRAILEGLAAAGKRVEALVPDDLAPVDHFHTRGKAATLELAALAGLGREQRVLDVGGGLGGPARVLAAELGCRVTVLDLTEEYCRVGEDLTRRTGLQGRVEFRHGDALSLPFPDGAFDVTWTQHATMNIADKPRLYGELRRVLGPGGRLALHEVMAGAEQPIHFPVPWARDPAISHLRAPEDVRRLIADAGFKELAWRDESATSLEWFRQRAAAARGAGGPPPLGLHLLLGAELGAMVANMLRNLEEHRIRIVMAVWERAPR